MSNPFDYFEKIICICGQHEPERWIKVQKEFERIGVLDRVERFDEVIDSEWLTETYGHNPEWSKTDYCHWKIISDTHEQNLENVFIFESDIHFIDTDLEKMSKSIESLEEVDWKLFYMGGVPHNVFKVVNEHLVNASMCQAHAYAINGKYCKEVAEKLMDGKIAIDQVYKRGRKFNLAHAAYATHPRFVIQEDENIQTRKQYSAIVWRKLVEPIVDKFKMKMEFVAVANRRDRGQRLLSRNIVASLDKTGMIASEGFMNIIDLGQKPIDRNSNPNLFKKVTREKLSKVHDFISKGKTCIMSDLDVVYLKNPWDTIISDYKDYDIIIPRKLDGSYDTGFYCVNPTKKMLELFDFGRSKKTENEYLNEKLSQDFTIKVRELSEKEFCSYEYFRKNDNSSPTMIHYNGIGNGWDKVEEMQKNEHWFIK